MFDHTVLLRFFFLPQYSDAMSWFSVPAHLCICLLKESVCPLPLLMVHHWHMLVKFMNISLECRQAFLKSMSQFWGKTSCSLHGKRIRQSYLAAWAIHRDNVQSISAMIQIFTRGSFIRCECLILATTTIFPRFPSLELMQQIQKPSGCMRSNFWRP